MRNFYRLLLKLYPRAHRERFESEMLQCFTSMSREPRNRRLWGGVRLLLSTFYDVITSAILVRLGGPKPPRRKRAGVERASSGWARDLLMGFRRTVRRPGFALVAVVTLAIGIGANILVFSVVYATLLSPMPYPEAERVVSVWPEHWFTRGELSYLDGRVETMTVAGSLSRSLTYVGSRAARAFRRPAVSSSPF